jgi:hypothetical protein
VCGSKPNDSGSQRLLTYAATKSSECVSLARYCRYDFDISLLVVKCHVNTCKDGVNTDLQLSMRARDSQNYVNRSSMKSIAP